MTSERKKARETQLERADGLGPSVAERMSAGKALREKTPRTSHAKWTVPPGRPDPVKVLEQSDRGRLPELLPIRYGRMRQSPFAFFRGSAAVMAWDLSRTPATGVHAQACGDCHAANFGGFASPERRLLFDINDFDETLRAPWEWDLKRLAASIVLASREIGMGAGGCRNAVLTMARSYRLHMREYARMRALEVWYSRMNAEVFVEEAKTAVSRKRWEEVEKKRGCRPRSTYSRKSRMW